VARRNVFEWSVDELAIVDDITASVDDITDR